MWPTALRDKKNIHRQTLRLVTITLRCKDIKRSVCARNWTVFILFFISDPPHCPTVLRAFTTAGAWRVFFFFLLYGGSQTYKCITATYFSNGPLTLLIEIVDRMVHLRAAVKQEEEEEDASRAGCCERSQDSWTVRWIRGKKQYKYCSVSCTDRSFNVFTPQCYRHEPQGLSVYAFLVSQSRGSHWLPLYDWQTATVWVKNLRLCSTEETTSPTSWMPWG